MAPRRPAHNMGTSQRNQWSPRNNWMETKFNNVSGVSNKDDLKLQELGDRASSSRPVLTHNPLRRNGRTEPRWRWERLGCSEPPENNPKNDQEKFCLLHRKPHPLNKCRRSKECRYCCNGCASPRHCACDCKEVRTCTECGSNSHVSSLHSGPAPVKPLAEMVRRGQKKHQCARASETVCR